MRLDEMIQITAPHFCAGVILGSDNIRVVRAAPILRYMLGWTQQRVRSYCATKHWTVEHLQF